MAENGVQTLNIHQTAPAFSLLMPVGYIVFSVFLLVFLGGWGGAGGGEGGHFSFYKLPVHYFGPLSMFVAV